LVWTDKYGENELSCKTLNWDICHNLLCSNGPHLWKSSTIQHPCETQQIQGNFQEKVVT